MRSVVTDRVAWSVCLSVGLSICRSVTLVSPAKTAKPIEMPLDDSGGGLREPCIRWGPDPPWEWAILRGEEVVSRCKVCGHSTVISAKTVEPIEMPFGF